MPRLFACVAGVLAWLNDMAGQLAPIAVQHWQDEAIRQQAMGVFAMWHGLASRWMDRIRTPESSLLLLQPRLVRLLQRVALQGHQAQPCKRPALGCEDHGRQVAVSACLNTIAQLCGAVVHLDWHLSGLELRRWKPTSPTTGSSSKSSSSTLGGPSLQQCAAVLDAEVRACPVLNCLVAVVRVARLLQLLPCLCDFTGSREPLTHAGSPLIAMRR
jgi:hypothetical protein